MNDTHLLFYVFERYSIFKVTRMSSVIPKETRGPWALMLTWWTAVKGIFLTILQSFSFILIFLFFYNFWLPWQPIKFGHLDRIHIFGRGLLNEHFYQTFDKMSDVRYKNSLLSSLETVSTLAMAIQNTIFVETDIMNVSFMYQLHCPYGFGGYNFYLFFIISFWFPRQPI